MASTVFVCAHTLIPQLIESGEDGSAVRARLFARIPVECDCRENWYALQTRPRSEQTVSTQLNHVGVEVFLPTRRTHPAEGKMKVVKQDPLFPGYLFCRINLGSGPKLYLINDVVRIVGVGKQPVPIDESEIQSVKMLVGSPYPIESEMLPRAGDPVRIQAGPFAGMSGTLVDVRGARKFVVSIPLLNRAVSVLIPTEWLSPSLVMA